jgi:serine/threonine-protein kinase
LEGLRHIDPALTEIAGARAFWAVWIWTDAFLSELEDGFVKARALAGLAPAASRAPDSSASTERSIAVLPFVDLSEKKDQDWFCDGIAEELLNALAPLPGLRVAARASAFSFRGKTDDLRSIGEKLNVTSVLEGSVRRAGDRVRITTRLSDTKEGRQLWSERFDRDVKDIFDVQEEIARAIADRLRVSIAGGGERLVQKPTANLEAYELMLKGRGFLNRRGPAIVNAIPCFEQAIALDPNLADAHAGLGDTYRLFGIYGLMPTQEAMRLARTSLERALAIDPDQVETLATLANITSTFEWNYPKSRALTERALRRDPSHVRALAESAVTTAAMMADQPSEALLQMVLDRIARARALDPLSAWAMAMEAMVLLILGREDEAVAIAAKAVATDPNNFTAHWLRVATLAQQDRAAEAEEAAKPGLEMSSRHPVLLSDLATLHARHGDPPTAESIYQELTERSKTAFISPASRAVAAAAAGRMTDARALLAKSIADHDAFLSFNKLPAWRPIWDDPECAAMLRHSALKQSAPV